MTYRSLISLPTLSIARDLDRLFDDVVAPVAAPAAWSPAVDVRETPEALVIEADLPGVAPADVQLHAEQQVLTLRGSRAATPAEGRAVLRERVAGAFARRFQLPRTVDVARIEARFANGVLTIRVPKAAEAQPRQIPIATDVSVN